MITVVLFAFIGVALCEIALRRHSRQVQPTLESTSDIGDFTRMLQGALIDFDGRTWQDDVGDDVIVCITIKGLTQQWLFNSSGHLLDIVPRGQGITP